MKETQLWILFYEWNSNFFLAMISLSNKEVLESTFNGLICNWKFDYHHTYWTLCDFVDKAVHKKSYVCPWILSQKSFFEQMYDYVEWPLTLLKVATENLKSFQKLWEKQQQPESNFPVTLSKHKLIFRCLSSFFFNIKWYELKKIDSRLFFTSGVEW